MEKIIIFDTTLRDGEQAPGASLNQKEKLDIAFALERLGVDVIEAGFPISSPGDFAAVSLVAKEIKKSAVCALARAIPKDIDSAFQATKKARQARIHVFLATSKIHMRYKLKKAEDEILRLAVKAVKYARNLCGDIEFSPEDASRTEREFLFRVVEAVITAGARTVNIPDTVGYATPDEFGKLIRDLIEAVPSMRDVVVSVHCHNDLGMATANALTAVVNGATQVEGTVNGIGERAGNTALEEIAMILDTRRNTLGKHTNIKTEEISRSSRLISTLTGYQVQPNKAIVGRNAFAHSSGIHQDGVLKQRATFEIIDPTRVGINESTLILGKTSGRHAFRKHLESLGHKLNDEELESAFLRFKDLADKKSEITDVDIEAILADEMRTLLDVFALEYIHVCGGTDETPTATVKLRKNGDVVEKTSQGDGQVDAVCNAIQRATGVTAKLISYNVNAITGGLDAQGDVTIQLDIDGKPVLGRGVSTDIIEASARAYLNAINKALSS
ncbi:MAG: 2-isopropylmalate synthase [Omnitrophica WOR_2 bacterium GWC2_44_8]|nr:MAG: 2-isopropylmalate synthase [Omnitrophica WOR_2 bacterium GWC2_44_8]